MSTLICDPCDPRDAYDAVSARHALDRSLPSPRTGWLQRLRTAWRAAARRRAEDRALMQLSDATLRDIGLAERRPPSPYSLGVLDQERGRWQ